MECGRGRRERFLKRSMVVGVSVGGGEGGVARVLEGGDGRVLEGVERIAGHAVSRATGV